MVAPIKMTVPCSTAASRASCWALLKRWISSIKRMVRRFCSDQRSRAFSTTSDILHPRGHGVELNKGGPGGGGDEQGQGGFTGTGGPKKIIEGSDPR